MSSDGSHPPEIPDDLTSPNLVAGLQESGADEEEIRGDTKTVRLRVFTGRVRPLVFGLAILLSLFELFALYVQPVEPWFHRGIFLSMTLMLIFALVPARGRAPRDRIPWYDWLLILLSIAPTAYIMATFEALSNRAGSSPTQLDVVFGGLAVLLVLEAMRRTSGNALPIICLVFIVYAMLGGAIPGVLGHRGYSLPRTISLLFSIEGLYGVPLGVGVTYVFAFVLFGVFLQRSAVGELFMQLALSLTGWTRGGPAKVPVISSALFGTISGSCVANVVIDGPLTIPLMQRGGMDKDTSAAVEAVASTGGQLMPPVMGVAAFLMADLIGRPYTEIIVAAAIPALLYYAALYFMIDFYALKHGLLGIPRSKLPHLGRLMRNQGYLLLPLAILLYALLVMDTSAIQAALWAIGITIIATWLRRSTRLMPRDIVDILAAAARGIMEVSATMAGAGIIIGVLGLTGMGIKATSTIIAYAGGQLLPALILTMIICLILGMGMPTTAAYATAAVVVPSAIIKMGVPELNAHMFIFYFACISAITPPVALAAYAAAAVAQASMWKVGLQAVKIGLAGFVVPYMFIYGPALLMEGEPLEVAWAAVTATVGVATLAASIQGYLVKGCLWFERVALFAGSLLLIKPGLETDVVGIGLLAAVAVIQRFNLIPRPGTSSPHSNVAG